MKRAFTLIELLVVIAIIAILAAILFPVFAQAKAAAKKTQALSNAKQLALAVIQYGGDVDDTYPAGKINFQNNGWHDGFGGWQYPSNPDQSNTDGLAWGNSTYPYTKSYALARSPSAQVWNLYGGDANRPGSTLMFNGVLQYSSQTAVTSPAVTVTLWSGGITTWVGRTWANPSLKCDDKNSACVYTANNGTTCSGNGCSDAPILYGGMPSYSKWIYGQGDNFAYVDGHAKYQSLNGGYKNDPWSYNGPNGAVLKDGGYGWNTNANGAHTCLFSPDNPCGL